MAKQTLNIKRSNPQAPFAPDRGTGWKPKPMPKPANLPKPKPCKTCGG